jgi:hypothetical protein
MEILSKGAVAMANAEAAQGRSAAVAREAIQSHRDILRSESQA